MDETYRMLGRDHDAELGREAAARQRVAALQRSGGVTRAEMVQQAAEPATRGRFRLALRRLVPVHGT